LSQPQWADYFQTFEPKNEAAALSLAVALQYAHWPDMVEQIRRLRSGTLSAEEFKILKITIARVRPHLDEIDVVLDKHLTNPEKVTVVPSCRPDSAFDMVYDFHEPGWPALINLVCSYIFILDNLAFSLKGSGFVLALQGQPLNATGRITEHHRKLVRKVCRSFEYTTFRQPLLNGTTVLSLSTAYCYAETEDVRQWIIKALNQGDGHYDLNKPKYSVETIDFLNNLYIGLADIPRGPGQGSVI
jgi:hypothetical protein